MDRVLSEKSVKEYARILKAIKNAGFHDDNLESLKAYFDKQEYAIQSRKTNVSACMNKHKSNPELRKALGEYLKALTEQHNKQKAEQKKSPKEESKHLDWDKVLEKAVTAINDEKYSLQERILIGLYTQLEPVRCDYTHIKLYAVDPKLDKGTYFIINDEKKEVVINDYKTAGKYGAIRQPLPERLADMITMWFKDESVMLPVTESTLSKRIKVLFKKITGKPMTVCALRHSRLTHLYKGCPKPLEIKRIAAAMGHSVETAMSYRFDG